MESCREEVVFKEPGSYRMSKQISGSGVGSRGETSWGDQWQQWDWEPCSGDIWRKRPETRVRHLGPGFVLPRIFISILYLRAIYVILEMFNSCTNTVATCSY